MSDRVRAVKGKKRVISEWPGKVFESRQGVFFEEGPQVENEVIFGYRGLLPGPMGLLGCRATQAWEM